MIITPIQKAQMSDSEKITVLRRRACDAIRKHDSFTRKVIQLAIDHRMIKFWDITNEEELKELLK